MDAARSTRPAQDSDEGFSLVEVLIAVLVLTAALLGLMTVQTRALSSVVLAEERQQATGYSNALIELARAYTADQEGFGKARDHALHEPGVPFSLVPASVTGVVAGTISDTTFDTKVYLQTTSDADLISVSAVTSWTSRNSSVGARTVITTTQLAAPVTP